jgi:hypothetical protein
LSYIGRKPTVGNFQICDAISVVNGQAAYTMQVGSVNVIPQSANHMIVSLNGTIQKPNSSFTVSGSTITFSSNLATGDVIDFIQILGDVLDLGVPSDATVTTAKLADDAVTAAKITDATITAAKLASGTVQNQSAFKNIIINGDMSIAQRGTSSSGITSSGYYTLDRFQTIISGLGTWTHSQSTDVPTGQGFAKSFKLDCTTADASPASSDLSIFRQRLEGQNLQYLKKGTASAESLTLSFWVKSNKTGTYVAEILDSDNSNRHINKSYTISSANTWEKKTITFAGDTTGGTLNNDNGVSLDLGFWLGAGTTFTSGTLQTSWGTNTSANRAVGQVNLADSTSNEWYITGVQLETGTAASDFEFLPTDITEDRCRRYYQIGGGCSGRAYSTTNGEFYYAFEKQMRSGPSVTLLDGTSIGEKAGKLHLAGVAGYNITNVSASNLTTKSINLNFTGSSLTSGSSMGILGNPIALDAEL